MRANPNSRALSTTNARREFGENTEVWASVRMTSASAFTVVTGRVQKLRKAGIEIGVFKNQPLQSGAISAYNVAKKLADHESAFFIDFG